MQNRAKFIFVFIILILISLLFFTLSKAGILKLNFISGIFSPIQKEIHKSFIQLTKFKGSPQVEKLKEENRLLVQKLVDQQKLIAQNKALLDQFQQISLKSSTLLPADVIGSPGFVPGISVAEFLVLNRGIADGVKVGDPVIIKNNLVGRVVKTLQNRSLINTVGNNSFFLGAKVGADKKTLGVVKGQGGGEIIMGNVLLSEVLKVGDIVLTNEDVFPQDLIIGKIISLNKNPSALFQEANVESFIDFSKLSTVFVQIQK
jgi:cell shape-determining protein MreC